MNNNSRTEEGLKEDKDKDEIMIEREKKAQQSSQGHCWQLRSYGEKRKRPCKAACMRQKRVVEDIEGSGNREGEWRREAEKMEQSSEQEG